MREIIEKFKIGTKVKITKYCGFNTGVTGTVNCPPNISILADDYGGNYFRKVQTLKGESIFVWIIFDEPQRDGDDDGPYGEAEIEVDYLEIITK